MHVLNTKLPHIRALGMCFALPTTGHYDGKEDEKCTTLSIRKRYYHILRKQRHVILKFYKKFLERKKFSKKNSMTLSLSESELSIKHDPKQNQLV